MNNPYVSLAETLRWKNHDYSHIPESYSRFLQSRLAQYTSRGGENAAALRSLTDSMGGAVNAFVRYPYVADQLHPRTRIHDDDNLIPLVGYALSFLGHLDFDNKEVRFFQIPAAYRRKLDVGHAEPASIPVYCDDYLKFPTMTGGNAVKPLQEENLRRFEGQVARSTALFREVDGVLDFVIAGTELLCVQEETEERKRFGSSSFRGLAGLNLITNPGVASTWAIADAILHEAVHSILYQIEPAHSPFFQDRIAARTRLRSPWTNRDISADNLFQAAYVWFGLLRFWERVAAVSTEPEVALYAAQRVTFIHAGFAMFDNVVQGSLTESAAEGLCAVLASV